VPVTSPADGALTILPVEKGLVLLGGMTAPAYLRVLVGQGKTVSAAVCTIGEPRKLFADFLPSTAFADYPASTFALVFDTVQAGPGQVGSHHAKGCPSPSGDLADRETTAEEVSNLTHKRYLKRKQQRSLVAG